MASTKLTQTKISDTYGGVLHSNGEALPVSTLIDIYDGLGNKSSLKLGRACNGATVCGPFTCDTLTTTSKLSASTQFDILNLLNVLHPVSSIIVTFNDSNPGTRTGWTGTTWSQVSQGRFLVGVGSDTVDGVFKTFTAGNNTGGEYQHLLTIPEMPNHRHLNGTADDTRAAGNSSFVYGETFIDMPGLAEGRQETSAGGTRVQGFTSYIGSNQPHNNTPPGFGLYVWQRTA
jgi:hypothetical protein